MAKEGEDDGRGREHGTGDRRPEQSVEKISEQGEGGRNQNEEQREGAQLGGAEEAEEQGQNRHARGHEHEQCPGHEGNRGYGLAGIVEKEGDHNDAKSGERQRDNHAGPSGVRRVERRNGGELVNSHHYADGPEQSAGEVDPMPGETEPLLDHSPTAAVAALDLELVKIAVAVLPAIKSGQRHEECERGGDENQPRESHGVRSAISGITKLVGLR